MATRPSPFDPWLCRFLAHVRRHSSTFSPTSSRSLERAGEALQVEPAFIEALFASATSRGLLRPTPAPRGKSRWAVSRKGEAYLAAQESMTTDAG